MGMFATIDYEIPCPECGGPIKNFQTKDPDVLELQPVPVETVSNFYSYCNGCGWWVDFTRKPYLVRDLL
jgi:hypothetical protein